jgi:hypothetical protein
MAKTNGRKIADLNAQKIIVFIQRHLYNQTTKLSYSTTAAMETLLGLPPLQLVVDKEARQAAYRLHCSSLFKKSDWRHSAIFKMATEDATSRGSILMALRLRAGRVLEFFLRRT